MISTSMSADAARRALEAAKGDDEFVRRYLDGDQAAFRQMQGLLQAAYPDSGPGDTGAAVDDSALRAPAAPATPAGDGDGAAMPQWLLDAGDAGFAPPKSPAHYQFDYAPNVEIDPEFDRQARDWMYKAELPAGWAAEITRDYQRRAAKPPSDDEVAQEREAVLGRLRRDWGDATDAKLAQVRELVRGIGDDRLTETLDRSGLGNNEWLIRQLAIHADRKAAKAAEGGGAEASEASESNGDTGAADHGAGHRPGEDNPSQFVQLSDKTGKSTIGETVGPEIVPIGDTGEGARGQVPGLIDPVPDILRDDEDGRRRGLERYFGTDFYTRTDTEPPPPGIGPIGLYRFGNWAGRGYGAGHTSPAFLSLTEAEQHVDPIKNADGTINLFDYVSQQHDLAYNNAQQKLLKDLKNPNVSAQRAFADYYKALADANREFLAKLASGRPGMALSGDPWETEMIRRAKETFPVMSARYDTFVRSVSQSKPLFDYGNRIQALADAQLKLKQLGLMVKGEVVGREVKATLDTLRNRIIELGGRLPIQDYGEGFAYVSSPKEADAAYARRKRGH